MTTADRHRRAPRIVVAVVLLVAVGLAGWWGLRVYEIRQVTHHPVVSVLESQGWPKEFDRTQRAGVLDGLFLGGMVEHASQRQILYRVDIEDLDEFRRQIEQDLFGSADRPSPFAAHGLRWERREFTDAASYHGHPVNGQGRLERVTVSFNHHGVEVRTFGR